MKVSELKELCEDFRIELPEVGSGPRGKLTAMDYEYALGTKFIEGRKYNEQQLRHLTLRRSCPPMKAYRYDKAPEELQSEIWSDPDWYAEQKYDGWRMMFTYIHGHGFMAWGGNLSSVDFLPVDYTQHIILSNGKPLSSLQLKGRSKDCEFILDTEALCYDTVTTKSGMPSANTREAVVTILGSNPERAHETQLVEQAQLQFAVFDYLSAENSKIINKYPMMSRRAAAAVTTKALNKAIEPQERALSFMTPKRAEGDNKKSMCHELWRAGEEGVILKHVSADYVPEGRLKTHQLKVKRTMSGEIGDDIDAFIVRAYDTEEWQAKGLIGGVELGVYVEGELHVIASVTSMPDDWRAELTDERDKAEADHRKPGYENKVLVVDGQELSGRNRKLMHARADWTRGYRKTKTASDCTFEFDEGREVKF